MKIFKKYKILKFRMKISYMAFVQNMTILELFLKAILKTYFRLERSIVSFRPNKLENSPYNEFLTDVMKGQCDLCSVIWFQYRHVLEAELGFPKIEWKYW